MSDREVEYEEMAARENPKGMGLRRRKGEQRESVTLLELLDFLVNTDPFKIGCKVCRGARNGDDTHYPSCELVAWRDTLAVSADLTK